MTKIDYSHFIFFWCMVAVIIILIGNLILEVF